MKMYYLRIYSSKNIRTGDIDTYRFGAEEEIDIEKLPQKEKLSLMDEAAHDLNCAGAAMVREIIIKNKAKEKEAESNG